MAGAVAAWSALPLAGGEKPGEVDEQGHAGLRIGPLEIGGAMRVNYINGDYPGMNEDGEIKLDTCRINLDYEQGPWLGAAEYRFYDGYNMLHTGWLGYKSGDGAVLRLGVNRAPFGAGPYGVSQSWFFDQHYYLGLADNMDLGLSYSRTFGDLALDLAYYLRDEGSWNGGTRQSSRYSYDVVDETGQGYRQRHQANFRAVYPMPDAAIPTDLGFSARAGGLKSSGPHDDGWHHSAALHMINRIGNLTLASQISHYRFRIDDHPLADGRVTDKLIDLGAYDFPNAVAAEGVIPAVSLSYRIDTPDIDWLDHVRPYVEWSALLKREASFNDSHLVTLGAAWSSGGWYVYSEVALSNGNEFVGAESASGDRLGVNADDRWQTRFNINFGYYF